MSNGRMRLIGLGLFALLLCGTSVHAQTPTREVAASPIVTGIGATGDAAVAAGAAGSLNAKFRTLTQQVSDLNTKLDNILTELNAKTEPTNTQPVSAATLPLPAGAASDASVDGLEADLALVKAAVDGLEADLALVKTAVEELASATNSGRVDINIARVNGAVPAAGCAPSQLISAATTNATSVKAAPGNVYMLTVTNTNAAARFLKLYNKASAPTVGTDTPVQTYLIPPTSSGFVIPVDVGMAFTTGIAFALTTDEAVADTGAVAAGEILVNLCSD